jgi:hypothetical protein
MYPNTSLADGLGVAGIIAPVTTANTQKATAAIDVSKWDSLLFVFQTGDMASETFDCGVETCDSDGTSNAVDITGKQATQLAANASANDSKQVVIAVKSADLITNGKRYVRGTMVTGGATGGPAACLVLGVPRYGPAEGVDLSSVVQVIK